MTKFEESLRKIKPRKKFLEFNAGITYWYCLSDLIQKFGNWHSDEEFQIVEEIRGSFALANKNLIDVNTKLAEEIANLKSQLQQQALPVVPEDVAKWISEDIENNTVVEDILTIIITSDDKDLKEYGLWIKKNPATYVIARTLGYTVEKPQLFYLRDELTGQFLAKDNQFKNEDRYFFWTGADPLTHSIGTAWKLTFTQQEIDSMETRSYELVPVEEGK